jgi:hypothetical protein
VLRQAELGQREGLIDVHELDPDWPADPHLIGSSCRGLKVETKMSAPVTRLWMMSLASGLEKSIAIDRLFRRAAVLP